MHHAACNINSISLSNVNGIHTSHICIHVADLHFTLLDLHVNWLHPTYLQKKKKKKKGDFNMKSLNVFLQSGDWKSEKHVPVIYAPTNINAGEEFEIKVSIGDEIKHPNTLEHHIGWVKLFFNVDGEKFPIELSNYTFSAHGESSIISEPIVFSKLKLQKSGTLFALSYCNIHGLWENNHYIEVN